MLCPKRAWTLQPRHRSLHNSTSISCHAFEHCVLPSRLSADTMKR